MDGVVGFAPRILLWEEIERRVPKPELPEFRRMLGSSLIDKNSGLQEEVLALVDIIKIVQADNDQLTQRMSKKPRLKPSPVHEMVKRQIQFLLNSLQTAAVPEAARCATPREREIAGFVTGGAIGTSSESVRPRSSRNSFRSASFRGSTPSAGPSSDRMSSARPSSQASAQSTASAPDLLGPMQAKLNVWDADEVAHELQQALREEASALMDDIEYLQACLEDETEDLQDAQRADRTGQAAGAVAEPTIEELRAYESKLQEQWLQREHQVRTEALLAGPGGLGGRQRPSTGERKSDSDPFLTRPGSGIDGPHTGPGVADQRSDPLLRHGLLEKSASLKPKHKRPGPLVLKPLASTATNSRTNHTSGTRDGLPPTPTHGRPPLAGSASSLAAGSSGSVGKRVGGAARLPPSHQPTVDCQEAYDTPHRPAARTPTPPSSPPRAGIGADPGRSGPAGRLGASPQQHRRLKVASPAR